MIRSLFLSMGELNKGARRPANVPPTNLRKVGVLGAGLMGAGIAYVSAQRRARCRADRPRSGIGRQGQGLFGQAHQLPDRQGPRQDRRQGGAARPHHADRGLCRAQGLRSHHRSGVRGSRDQGGGDEEGAGHCRTRRRFSPATPRPCRSARSPGRRSSPEQFHRRAFLLAGREDDADRDHHGREDRREGARDGDGFRSRDQEDADRGQRLPRFLCQPLRRQLHGRRRTRW